MKILSIETSCDETGISIIESSGNSSFSLLGNALASQIDLHIQYGGVFPAMAKRVHTEKIIPLIIEALTQANLLLEEKRILTEEQKQKIQDICTKDTQLAIYLIEFLEKYKTPEIDYLAFTIGPGLEPALWVGVNTAKSLFSIWSETKEMQIVPINHMEGHIVTAAFEKITEDLLQNNNNFIGPRVSSPDQKNHHSFEDGKRSENENSDDLKPSQNAHSDGLVNLPEDQKKEYFGEMTVSYNIKPLDFPVLALLVSGGHTEIVLAQNFGIYKKIGQTRDDAVGEAFDKVARMLGLEYPGGPKVSKLAKEFRASGVTQEFIMPRPMLHSPDYDFSFSGIKTAMLYKIAEITNNNEHGLTDLEKMSLACAFEDAAIETLIKKTLKASEEYNPQTIIVGGGVAGNTYLKEQLIKVFQEHFPNTQTLFPEPILATDNALMIAMAALLQIQAGTIKDSYDLSTLRADGNLSIG